MTAEDKSIFSKVMEKRINEIIEECLKKKLYVTTEQLSYAISKVSINLLEEIEDKHDIISDLESDVNKLQKDIEHLETECNDLTNDNNGINDSMVEFNDRIDNFVDEMEESVSSIMLKLMPEFNKKISKEVKKHFIALSEYVIKNFKEKE